MTHQSNKGECCKKCFSNLRAEGEYCGCPCHTQRKETESWEGGEDKINVLSNLLHEFLKDCLQDPMEGAPLARRARKRIYAERILEIESQTLTKHTNEVLEEEREDLAAKVKKLKGGYNCHECGSEGFHDACDQIIEILHQHQVKEVAEDKKDI